MIAISQQAQAVFDQLIHQLGGKDYIRFRSEASNPLAFECIGAFSSYYGPAKMFSLMRTTAARGKLMCDPEICFFHFESDRNGLCRGSYPYSFQLDLLGICQESIELVDGAFVVHSIMQRLHTGFADNWLVAVKEQGFID